MPYKLKKEELDALALVAQEVLIPHQKDVLKSWINSYPEVDSQRILTPKDFAQLCQQELEALTNALHTGKLKPYYDHISKLGFKLAETGIDFSGIPVFIHALEESYTELLLKRFPDIKRLSVILIALDNVLHDILTTVITSYFNRVRERLTEELTRGRILEQAFRPRLAPKVTGLDIGVVYTSATEKALIGGDFYDFFYLPSGDLAFAIGDVSGKGVEAATTAAMTKFMFRGFAFEFGKPDEVLKRLNKALAYTLGTSELVTAAYATYHSASGMMRMAGAGHPSPFYRPVGKEATSLNLDGILLGALPDLICYESSLTLNKGDVLLFFTDGLVEARGANGFFGYERVKQFLETYEVTSAQRLVDDLLETCLSFTNNRLSDDLAMVCFYKV